MMTIKTSKKMRLSIVMLGHLRKLSRRPDGKGSIYSYEQREALIRRGLVTSSTSDYAVLTDAGRGQIVFHEIKREDGHYVGCDYSRPPFIMNSDGTYMKHMADRWKTCHRCQAVFEFPEGAVFK